MNGILLRRLFKAISTDDKESLEQLSKKIIEEETKLGHSTLAKELNEILDRKKISRPQTQQYGTGGLSTLPQSKRQNEALVKIISREQLRFHMVLDYAEEQRLVRIEQEYAARARLAKFNLQPRKKILLYGPPGCGKTMASERLAWNIGLPLYKVRFDTLISSYFGETSSNLRSVFEMSSRNPCVLLLDECDIIAKSREASQDVGEVARIVNMLLMLLDEYDSQGILVATTNLEGTLDKAIYRRFDDIIEFHRPNKEQIERLLRLTLSSMKSSLDINWRQIVERMSGFSSANVVKVGENAAKISVLYGEGEVDQLFLEQAIDEMKVI
jgi:SpoVK/Ycf46/Vps4 family AAA+-type ATPase